MLGKETNITVVPGTFAVRRHRRRKLSKLNADGKLVLVSPKHVTVGDIDVAVSDIDVASGFLVLGQTSRTRMFRVAIRDRSLRSN